MKMGPQARNIGFRVREKVARQSPRLPGIDMARAWDSFSWCCHLDPLCMAAKLSHIGGDVEGLAYRLRWPTNCG
jgi:hypothetical protein